VENKFDVQGYQRIISRTGIKNWTFFSDVSKEISSAEKAGMRGYVLVREGNKPLSDAERAETEVITDGLSRIAGLLKTREDPGASAPDKLGFC
jgi:methionine salvage enolase-phosphatase E1